ncbi:MAG TPA: Ig-like domain-containing protein [Allosphingosinicella sp.]|nr:Ig-like domain-containing protein [Allosphingosinicella sp.]
MPINGTPGDDYLVGTSGDDELNGLAGNDILDGLDGADIMDGGIGDDIFVVDNAGDVIRELIGEGGDTVFARVSYVLTAGAYVETLSTIQHNATTAINLVGNAFAQTIYGNYGANVLNGGGGGDVLLGMFGDDVYRVFGQTDQVIEAAGQGSDTVFTSASYVLADGQEIEALSTESHASTAAINLGGNAFNQNIVGNYGANVLDGRGGADVLVGMFGNDVYRIYSQADQVIETAGQGDDIIFTSASYTLGAGLSVETLSTAFHAGTDAINLTGNVLNQTIVGNFGANTLSGGGGTGDLMYGLAGNDTYVVWNGFDKVFEAAGGGDDLVLTSFSYALLADQEVETLSASFHAGTASINLTGNNLSNTLIGNYGRNVLTGLGGGDRMVGLKDNDTYIIYDSRDVVVEAAGEGNDTVSSFVSYVLTAGQEVESLTVATTLAALDPINLTGNEFGQSLLGNSGRNLLDGGLGNDLLKGWFGNDTFAFTTALGPNNIDLIDDFQITEDEILLSAAIFTAIAPGRVALSQIAYGPAATTAEHRIILDPTTGALYYDADGNGAGAAVQFSGINPGEHNIADFKIFVEGPNHAPVANADQAQVDKGQATATATGNVLTNDTDAEGNALFVTAVQGSFAQVGQQITGTYGKITINADGSYSYVLNRTDPDTVALGLGMSGVDSFTYQVSDGRGGSASSTIAVTVIGGPQPYTVTVNSPEPVEGDSGTLVPAVFTIRLDRPAETSFTVNYQTQLAPGGGNTTLPGSTDDFVSASGQIQFVPGQQEATVTIQVVGDELVEGFEYFAVSFSSAAFANGVLGIASIIDNETYNQTPDKGLHDSDDIHGKAGKTILLLDNDSLVTTASLFSGFEEIQLGSGRTEPGVDGHTYSFTLDDDNAPNFGTGIFVNGLQLKADGDGAGPQTAETVFMDTTAVTTFTVNLVGGTGNDAMRSGIGQDQASLGGGDDIVYITTTGNNDRYFMGMGFDTIDVTAMASVGLSFHLDDPRTVIVHSGNPLFGSTIDMFERIVANGQTITLSGAAFALYGGSTIGGINLDTLIQGAGGYVINDGAPVFFGANLPASPLPINYASSVVTGYLDFQPLTTGLVIAPGQGVKTAGGATLFGANLANYSVIGTAQDDHIDRSDAARSATGQHNFFLVGGNGNDYLRGGSTMEAGQGNDMIVLDSPGATASGGAGADTFVMPTSAALSGPGGGNAPFQILDYAVADDTINLFQAGDLALGQLSASAFVVGTAAGDADDRIIYNNTTGALFYDADGNGAGAAVQFATLSTGLALTASEFFVIAG